MRFGGFAPIKAMVSHTLNSVAGKWVGESNLPVLVRRGALGENSPNADLCLTALHPVFVEGFLMPVGELVNGTSIIFEAADGRDTLDFFNIELDRNDILDVQGASCESLYRAGTERCAPLVLGFDGRRSRLQSHMRSVASLVIDRRQPIDIIRDKLEERAVGFARAREFMTVAARSMDAVKLLSVLQAHGDALVLLELAKEVLDQVAPFVGGGVERCGRRDTVAV